MARPRVPVEVLRGEVERTGSVRQAARNLRLSRGAIRRSLEEAAQHSGPHNLHRSTDSTAQPEGKSTGRGTTPFVATATPPREETVRKYGACSSDTADLIDGARQELSYLYRQDLLESQILGRFYDDLFSEWVARERTKARPGRWEK